MIYEKWIELKKIRDICNISIENKRTSKEIGSSLEANLIISVNEKRLELIKDIDLAELCITSNVEIKDTIKNEVIVETNKAEGNKCPVCWKIIKDGCKRHPQ